MIGSADGLDLPALSQRNEIRRPPLHIHGIVNPVHIDHICVEALLAAIQHLLHRIGRITGDLGGEFGGKDHMVTRYFLDEIAQDSLGSSLTVNGGGIP